MIEKEMEGGKLINSITFEEFLNGEILILRCMGLSYFNRVFSHSEEIEKWWEKIIPFCGILIVCLSTYLELIRVIRVIDVDFTHAIDILSAMSSGMLCTFKVRFIKNKNITLWMVKWKFCYIDDFLLQLGNS